jgi:hypothetical protein
MATDASSTKLLEEGVFHVHDLNTGTRVDNFRMKRFPFQTEDGLSFCRESLLEDDVSILQSLQYSSLTILADPGHNRVVLPILPSWPSKTFRTKTRYSLLSYE